MNMDIRGKLTTAYSETRRILRLTRKPKRLEYNEIAKITGIGMIGIGLIGFVIFIIAEMARLI